MATRVNPSCMSMRLRTLAPIVTCEIFSKPFKGSQMTPNGRCTSTASSLTHRRCSAYSRWAIRVVEQTTSHHLCGRSVWRTTPHHHASTPFDFFSSEHEIQRDLTRSALFFRFGHSIKCSTPRPLRTRSSRSLRPLCTTRMTKA